MTILDSFLCLSGCPRFTRPPASASSWMESLLGGGFWWDHISPAVTGTSVVPGPGLTRQDSWTLWMTAALPCLPGSLLRCAIWLPEWLPEVAEKQPRCCRGLKLWIKGLEAKKINPSSFLHPHPYLMDCFKVTCRMSNWPVIPREFMASSLTRPPGVCIPFSPASSLFLSHFCSPGIAESNIALASNLCCRFYSLGNLVKTMIKKKKKSHVISSVRHPANSLFSS